MAKTLKIKKVEGLLYLCNGIRGTDQLHGYRAADLHLFSPYMQMAGFLMTQFMLLFLAHLSRRLIGELIGY